ncbi:hypothetical protein SFRURICE_017167 [Spodoptera frugiperda]|nr:hypothetical protein SFRURICE_017167 [Spodoptera frugiperda]
MLCYITVDVFGFHQLYSLLSTGGNVLSYVFYNIKRCVLWMCDTDGFPTILYYDTSYTEAAHLTRTAT